MTQVFQNPMPLLSVIIPCYNHAKYLGQAIASVQQQSYAPLEIIVVDDGSKDDTKAVAARYAGVHYVYQKNSGLSAARNMGIAKSSGALLLFLDADDWLLPGALETGASLLLSNPQLAFVSGGHLKVSDAGETLETSNLAVEKDHYLWLLKKNYIGMHATVLYRRWAFDDYLFDTDLKACEDYDVYLHIARKHPVLHHTHLIAAYRMHGHNMSRNIPLMFGCVMNVLQRQIPYLQNEQEKAWLEDGMATWKKYYAEHLYAFLSDDLKNEKGTAKEAEVSLLKEHDAERYGWYMDEKAKWLAYRKAQRRKKWKMAIKQLLPAPLVRMYKQTSGHFTPAAGKVKWGDLKRTTPFSKDFGFDRGGAVDRYYIETFLKAHAPLIKGHVIEVQDNHYTLQFGGDAVAKSDVLHVHEGNPKATLVADLSNAPHLSGDTYDCIILTQTLQFIFDFRAAIQTCFRILKPGGTLLLTVPYLSPIDRGEWAKSWYWSFTSHAIEKLMLESFGTGNYEVEAFGNIMSATAFINGMGLQDINLKDLEWNDPACQLIVAARATKPTNNVLA